MHYPNNLRVKEEIYLAKEKAYLAKRKHKSLVMISGGLDSVAMLANLLQHTDDDVHVHHVEIRNSESRWEIENQTLDRILPYIREHYRDFVYSTSKYEFMMHWGGGNDMTLVMFQAARVVCAEGTFMDVVWTGHMLSPIVDYQEAGAVFAACYVGKWYKPVWLYPLSKASKFDVWHSIPPELAEMTWSCRTPLFDGTTYTPCKKCHACETRAEYTKQIEKSKSQQAI